MKSIKKLYDRKWEAPFAYLELDENNIIHVKGKEGVDVTKKDFELLDEWITSLDVDKVIILADRTKSYSHTFDAQKFLMEKKNITALAMYVTHPLSLEFAEMAKDVYLRNFPVKVFTDKKESLKWLNSFLSFAIVFLQDIPLLISSLIIPA